MHMDSMIVQNNAVKTLRKEAVTSGEDSGVEGDGKKNGPTYMLGVRFGCVALRWGLANNCRRVKFLAIDDEPRQHKRLVRYWRWLGLREVRYVGDGLGDVPDRLVWGGRGTVMEGDIRELLEKWDGVWGTEGWEALEGL